MQNSIKVYSDLRVAEKNYFRQPEQPQFQIYSHVLPALPDWTDKEYKCKEEIVNLFNLTCTCREYKLKSRKYPHRDIRGLCIHIFTKIKHSKAKEHLDQLSFMLLQNAAVFGEKYLLKGSMEGKYIYIGVTPRNEWINIYTQFPVYYNLGKKDETYFKYSYSVKQDRWAYGTYPYNELNMKPVILQAIQLLKKPQK